MYYTHLVEMLSVPGRSGSPDATSRMVWFSGTRLGVFEVPPHVHADMASAVSNASVIRKTLNKPSFG
jgi:hypothetical protein